MGLVLRKVCCGFVKFGVRAIVLERKASDSAILESWGFVRFFMKVKLCQYILDSSEWYILGLLVEKMLQDGHVWE